jgi:hypothetical protein
VTRTTSTTQPSRSMPSMESVSATTARSSSCGTHMRLEGGDRSGYARRMVTASAARRFVPLAWVGPCKPGGPLTASNLEHSTDLLGGPAARIVCSHPACCTQPQLANCNAPLCRSAPHVRLPMHLCTLTDCPVHLCCRARLEQVIKESSTPAGALPHTVTITVPASAAPPGAGADAAAGSAAGVGVEGGMPCTAGADGEAGPSAGTSETLWFTHSRQVSGRKGRGGVRMGQPMHAKRGHALGLVAGTAGFLGSAGPQRRCRWGKVEGGACQQRTARGAGLCLLAPSPLS